MKFAILSLAAAAGLALSADTVSAQYRTYYGPSYGYGGYRSSYYSPSYVYPAGGFYNSGVGVTVGGPRGVISIGNTYPSYYSGYGSYYSRPYYSGYNSYYGRSYYGGSRRGYYGRRW